MDESTEAIKNVLAAKPSYWTIYGKPRTMAKMEEFGICPVCSEERIRIRVRERSQRRYQKYKTHTSDYYDVELRCFACGLKHEEELSKVEESMYCFMCATSMESAVQAVFNMIENDVGVEGDLI